MRLVAPLLVVEAKQGIEGTDPIPQLYGEMLAAAWLNWQANQIFRPNDLGLSGSLIQGQSGDRPLKLDVWAQRC
jgi:hypothetical protein